MTATLRQAGGTVEGLLHAGFSQVERVGPGRWAVGTGEGAVGEARIADGWLTVRVGVERQPVDAWEALAANRRLGGLCKLSLASSGSFEAIAEIALAGQTEDGMERRLGEVASELSALGGDWAGRQTERAAGISEDRPIGADTLSSLGESGWPVTVRPSGAAAVRLEVPGEFCQAQVVENEGGGVVRFAVSLAPAGDLSGACREATALLMLRVSAATRLARAYASEDRSCVGFEVRARKPVAPTEVGHALSALSVACGMCRRELAALRDEGVAREYLAANGRGG